MVHGFDDSERHIEIPDLLHMCAPCSELPSNTSIMVGKDLAPAPALKLVIRIRNHGK